MCRSAGLSCLDGGITTAQSLAKQAESQGVLHLLTLSRIEVILEAQRSGSLPAYKGGLLRGVIGAALYKICCPFVGRQCDECTLAARCVYWQVFRTPMPEGLGFGGDFAPHPFVISPGDFGKRDYERGERLRFWLTLVGRAIPLLPYFVAAFQIAGERGLGKERTPFALVGLRALRPDGGWAEMEVGPRVYGPSVLEWDALSEGAEAAAQGAELRCLTPMRLARRGAVMRRLELPLLVETLARRVRALVRAHCMEPSESAGGSGNGAEGVGDGTHAAQDDGEEAKLRDLVGQVRWTARGKWVQRRHWSARQQKEIELGGVFGEMRMEGPLGELWPLLRAGELLHVGKSTSYGYGWYTVEGVQE